VTPEQLNQISGQVVDAALEVHSHLGPGLLESSYQACLTHELTIRGHEVRCQIPLPLIYKGVKLDLGYRIDMLVNNAVIVEIKSIEKLLPVHEAQLLSYLRLSDKRLGLILNFKSALMKEGIKRMVNRI
jgi:GxxExxY protein